MLTWTCTCGHTVQSRRLVYPIRCSCGRVAREDGTVTEPPAGWRGVGDVIAAATKAVGIQPCGGCEERRRRLNERFPFSSTG